MRLHNEIRPFELIGSCVGYPFFLILYSGQKSQSHLYEHIFSNAFQPYLSLFGSNSLTLATTKLLKPPYPYLTTKSRICEKRLVYCKSKGTNKETGLSLFGYMTMFGKVNNICFVNFSYYSL